MVFKEARPEDRDVEGYPIGALPKVHYHYGYRPKDSGYLLPPTEVKLDTPEASRTEVLRRVAGLPGWVALVWMTTEPIPIRD